MPFSKIQFIVLHHCSNIFYKVRLLCIFVQNKKKDKYTEHIQNVAGKGIVKSPMHTFKNKLTKQKCLQYHPTNPKKKQ